MTQGHGLEAEPATEIILSGIDTKQDILMTNTMAAFTVYSRLISGYHARKDGLVVEILADILRSLVDIEVESHPVAGSVAEITFGVPQRCPC